MDVLVVQSMSRIHLQTAIDTTDDRGTDPFKLGLLFTLGGGVGIVAGMDFDHGCAGLHCRINLSWIWVDE